MDIRKILPIVFSGMLTFSLLTGNVHAQDGEGSYSLYFNQVDIDADGTFDYAECTGYDKTVSEIVIPDTVYGLPVKAIGSSAFVSCNELTSVILPDSIVSIERNAFWKCRGLTSITLPDSIVSIGEKAFQECGFKSITIPEGVKKLDTWAFCHCEDLVTVTLPESLESVGYGVFQGCVSLEKVNIPEGITEISANMFLSCEFLEKITVPEGVTSIGGGAFANCYSLRSINIPENVTKIGAYAFHNCMCLESITIPQKTESIDEGAFADCSRLKSIIFENAECDIFDSAETLYRWHDEDTWTAYFDGVIYGHKDSTAQAYAKKYGYKFGDLDSNEKYNYKTVRGDANIDGAVNVRDTAFIARMIAQGKADELPLAADFNSDGNVNVRDAAAIAIYLASGNN